MARDVAKGVTRLLFRQDLFAMCEVPLPNNRRADMMAVDAKGGLTIVETAAALGVSHTTVSEDWRFARAWLHNALVGEPGGRAA